MPSILEIKNEAIAASSPHHARIREEWRIFQNMDYDENARVLKNMAPRAQRSLNNKVQQGILRLISPFMAQASRMEVQPNRSDTLEEDLVFTKDLENWLVMHQEADNETESLKNSILHNLVSGVAVRKQYFDLRTRIFRSEVVNPLSFAVDGAASRIDFSDASAIVQCYEHDEIYLQRHYDWRPREPKREVYASGGLRYRLPVHRLYEVWLRRELAEECDDIDQSALERTDKQVFRAVLIDDEVVKLKPTPFWWPDFPYTAWRNFSLGMDDRKATSWWGFGYGTLLNPQQKFLDEMLATLVAIARNMPTGQAIITKGALDPEQQYNLDGQIVELQAGKDIGVDFQKIPPDQIPPVFAEMTQYIAQVMEGMMPSLSDVFVGGADGANESGRAINSKQWAAHSQLSDNLTRMDGFRRRSVIQQLVGIQQTAKKPLSPHIWRGSLDLPDYFPEEARYLGFDVVSADAGSMPHSPLAKLQVAQTLASMGYIMSVEDLLTFSGLDKGYGLNPDMFVDMMQMMPQGAGGIPVQPGNEQVIAGAEAPLP